MKKEEPEAPPTIACAIIDGVLTFAGNLAGLEMFEALVSEFVATYKAAPGEGDPAGHVGIAQFPSVNIFNEEGVSRLLTLMEDHDKWDPLVSAETPS